MRGGLHIIAIGVCSALLGCAPPTGGVFAPEWIAAPSEAEVDDASGRARVRLENQARRTVTLLVAFEGPFDGASGEHVVHAGEAVEVETLVMRGVPGIVEGALVLREGIREQRVRLVGARRVERPIGRREESQLRGCTAAGCRPSEGGGPAGKSPTRD